MRCLAATVDNFNLCGSVIEMQQQNTMVCLTTSSFLRFLTSLGVILSMLVGCANDPSPLATWEHSSSGLFDAAVSNNGRFAVVSSFSDGTSLWDLHSNKRLYDWRHQDGGENDISLSVFSPDDRYVLTADTNTFVIWSVEKRQSLRILGG